MSETFVGIQYIPNTNIANVYTIKAGNFDIAVDKAVDYLYDEYEAILLTEKQFLKVADKINQIVKEKFDEG